VWRDTGHAFRCKFHGEYDSEKKFENRSTFVKLINECIVAQFLLRHGMYVSFTINNDEIIKGPDF